ncbi:hypothetical protein JXA85_01290 [Candidatus Woesearchaeota archaeon]|nr:hypothetical protein [Candidatus Woesearchaeota archaeon]
MANWNVLMETVLKQLGYCLDRVIATMPGIAFFLLFIGAGYLISSLLGWILKKILYKINIDKRLRGVDLHDSLGAISIAKIFGMILKWYVFFLFLNEGVGYLELDAFTQTINRVVSWLPSLIVGIMVVISGFILIDFIVNKILELKNNYIETIANIVKLILIVIIFFTALEQLGVKTSLAQSIVLMLLAAFLATLVLAFGIGAGLAIKDEIKPIIKKHLKRFR